MKAESSINGVVKPPRNNVYSRPAAKRVSSAIRQLHPHLSFSPTSSGISKSRSKASLPSPRRLAPSLSSESLLALENQRKRQQQIIALEREVRGLLEEEYRDDVKSYMHQMELLTMCSAASIDMQPELQWHMRGCLVEFLIEVHLNFRLRPETLYLTCNIVDRYVSRRVVYKKHYQLVGCAALWIAAKFEDAKERVPTVKDLCEICRDAYDESAFIQMEGHVLATIAWKIGHPTAEAWLRVACCGFCFEDTQTQHVARFLMEITLFHREYVQFTPSAIADAALLLSRYTLGKQRRPHEETETIIAVVQFLDTQLAERLDHLSQILVKKYSYSYYSKASTFIVQYYLQGRRYVYVPPSLAIAQPLPPVPVTPINRTPRLSNWTNSSSSISSTPSFSGSDFTDFSSETEDESMPSTPSTSANSSVIVEPFTFHAAPSVNTSSNKENLPVVGGLNAQASTMSGLSLVRDGTRSRKSSLEELEAGVVDLCQPSPGSRDSTTYIPRAALHSLTPNNRARSQTSLV